MNSKSDLNHSSFELRKDLRSLDMSLTSKNSLVRGKVRLGAAMEIAHRYIYRLGERRGSPEECFYQINKDLNNRQHHSIWQPKSES